MRTLAVLHVMSAPVTPNAVIHIIGDTGNGDHEYRVIKSGRVVHQSCDGFVAAGFAMHEALSLDLSENCPWASL